MGFAYYSFTYLKQFLINKYVVQYSMYKQNLQLLLLTEEFRVPCYCGAKLRYNCQVIIIGLILLILLYNWQHFGNFLFFVWH